MKAEKKVHFDTKKSLEIKKVKKKIKIFRAPILL
jgi:hypothetical protein